MLDWLQDALKTDQNIPLKDVAARLGLALILGFVVAGIYRWTRSPDREQAPNLATTLVLLSILIALVTQVIGNNAARAFSLVGTLAIVRFRTVIEDTRDTAFVIFAVVVGMAAGAGYRDVALLGLAFVGLAALILHLPGRLRQPIQKSILLSVRIGCGHDPDFVLKEVFANHLSQWHLTATATARQGAALEMTYSAQLRAGASPTAIVAELNQREGVQNVELRQVG
jgi:hypothetical protein